MSKPTTKNSRIPKIKNEEHLTKILASDYMLYNEMTVFMESLENFGYVVPEFYKQELLKLIERKEKLEKQRFKFLSQKNRHNEKKREEKRLEKERLSTDRLKNENAL